LRMPLASFMEHENVLIGDAVRHYQSHAAGKLNITFCTSIKHSQMTADMFNVAGIPSVHMDGETPEDDRKRMARAFAKRELMNICSVDLLCFGYDLASASGVKDAVIESISDLRPTKSRPLQRQKNGRVLRYKDYPAIILDHSGNAALHGMPCEDVEWTLQGRKKNVAGDDEKAIPVRQCPQCYYVDRPSPSCKNCGHVYEIDSRMVEHIDGELQEVTKEQYEQLLIENEKKKKEARQTVGRAKTIAELQEIAKERGYAPGWVLQMARVKGIRA